MPPPADQLRVVLRPRGVSAGVVPALTLCFLDPNLAVTRDEAFLAGLPAEEREEWNRLWTDIRAHLDQIK